MQTSLFMPHPEMCFSSLSRTSDPATVTDYRGQLQLVDVGEFDAPPVTIRGLGSRTRVVGQSLVELGKCPAPEMIEEHTCADKAAVLISSVTSSEETDLLDIVLESAPGPYTFDIQGINPFGKKSLLGKAACIDVAESDGVSFENLTFEGCNLSAVRAVNSRRISLRNILIKGGSYGLAI